MENEENNNLEKSNSKHNNSSININDTNNNINIEKDKKELLQNISPKINNIINQKNNIINDINNNNNIENLKFSESDLVQQIKNEEYNNYKEKKIKLYNFYQTLLNFRQKLIIKEKHLNQREKSLLEFEKILKANESILKNNIEQFESYMRSKILEIKTQFNQIEQLQFNKEQYLKQKEEEIKTENNYINLLTSKNIKRCSNCNCDLIDKEELNNQIYNNNYCETCNNYLKNIFHQKVKSANDLNNNNILMNQKKMEKNNQINFQSKTLGELNNENNGFNYSYLCPICNFYNL